MPVASAVRVSPTWAVPVMLGSARWPACWEEAEPPPPRSVAALVSSSSLSASSVKVHLHLDDLARVVVVQGVGGSGCPVDLSVVGEPLVCEGRVGQGRRRRICPTWMSAVRVSPTCGDAGDAWECPWRCCLVWPPLAR